ncbi:MAG: 2,3,4,5-tetrahydropyridine-2,6-dicarboxylate N-succinyltransferase [Marinicaulis sp.]|nr:2,3,4,5-tetrahydropyridine-2,6-dicarboxylate N-succinyltransferase [Marinicaulis sp.]
MTNTHILEEVVNAAWDDLENISTNTHGDIREAVAKALQLLDSGSLRVAEKSGEEWVVQQWLKRAVLLSFRLFPNTLIEGAPGIIKGVWWDKVPSKFDGWSPTDFERAGHRAVPPATVRRGAYIGPNVVLMPSFVDIGAYVGEGTMIDTWASIGSCAQVGKNCHISAGTGIGGVLEPLQANPVIIEDNCFIGARSEVVEGVIVREGSVIAMGVFITASTKIVYRDTGKVIYGEVPPFSVVVPGSLPSENGGPNLYCAVIIKQVDDQTRAKTSVNELLRD